MSNPLVSYSTTHYGTDLAWDIFCDFDGTIALVDVTDTLLERFARSSWQAIEQIWKAGIIGSRECLTRQIPLLDMSRSELNQHLDTIEIDPYFPTFVAEAQARGHRITVVSDGLDYSIQCILAQYKLTSVPVIANRLEQQSKRTWQITFPNFDANCRAASGHCKCATVAQTQRSTASNRRSLLIGDGTSDFCAAQAVDFVFAKHKLITHCIQWELPHYAIQNFADALNLLNTLDHMTPSGIPALVGAHSTMETL
ncbi:MAG: MtnX-like HAD-IB family phosphatase [Rhizonema sp. PD37]|nr:MtnX-like HAD-IB family phosphatase [Rhizonema sp. PD37]